VAAWHTLIHYMIITHYTAMCLCLDYFILLQIFGANMNIDFYLQMFALSCCLSAGLDGMVMMLSGLFLDLTYVLFSFHFFLIQRVPFNVCTLGTCL